MALYKEVQEYYENGLHIPEDITLLFADDNFGTVRRLPSGKESTRRGGAGVGSTFAQLDTKLTDEYRFITTWSTSELREATSGSIATRVRRFGSSWSKRTIEEPMISGFLTWEI